MTVTRRRTPRFTGLCPRAPPRAGRGGWCARPPRRCARSRHTAGRRRRRGSTTCSSPLIRRATRSLLRVPSRRVRCGSASRLRTHCGSVGAPPREPTAAYTPSCSTRIRGTLRVAPVRAPVIVNSTTCRMRGTDHLPVRCAALTGQIGRNVACGIYEWRPSPCREFSEGEAACDKARARHGLPPWNAQSA